MSVVMPVYRGERYVAAAIESVLAQTYPEVELVIVNDGSPDDSAKQIRRFLSDPRVRYIEQANAGVANARNVGIDNASGSFVALLDQDDLWLPNKLELQMPYLFAHPEIGFVHSRVECVDGDGSPRTCEGAIEVYPFSGACAGRLLLGNRIAPLTVVMRMACIEKVGKFDQRFAPADDWEMWLRIARLYPVGFLDAVTARYRFHGQNISGDRLVMHQTVIRIIDSICERFPDIPQSVGAAPVAQARYAALRYVAQTLEKLGRRGEARSYWKEAYGTVGDIEALLAIFGMPVMQRRRFERLLNRMPRSSRILTRYLYKATRNLGTHSRIADRG